MRPHEPQPSARFFLAVGALSILPFILLGITAVRCSASRVAHDVGHSLATGALDTLTPTSPNVLSGAGDQESPVSPVTPGDSGLSLPPPPTDGTTPETLRWAAYTILVIGASVLYRYRYAILGFLNIPGATNPPNPTTVSPTFLVCGNKVLELEPLETPQSPTDHSLSASSGSPSPQHKTGE